MHTTSCGRIIRLPIFLCLLLAATRGLPIDILPPGQRPAPPGVQALIGAKVVTKPGEVLNPATIIIRDGLIAAVGQNIAVPADAMIQDRAGTTIYAGFIDPYLVVSPGTRAISTTATEPIAQSSASLTAGGVRFFGVPGEEIDPGNPGSGHESKRVTPERRMERDYAPDLELLEQLRELGFTAANVVPGRGIIRGTSVFVALSDDNPNEAILKPEVCQHLAFESEPGDDKAYPRSLMGVIATIRQTFLDADFYAKDHEHYRQKTQGRRRPTFNPSLAALAPAGKDIPVVIEPGSVLMVDRAVRVAREFNLRFYLVSCGQEWRRPDLIKGISVPFVVPVNFPELPKLPEDADWHQVSLDQLRVWDWAPENPVFLRRQGVDIALTTFGLSEKKHFRKKLRFASDRGLAEDDALAALTVTPAKLCGIDDRLGTIEPGKVANLTVVSGETYFEPKNKVREVWIDGRVFPVKSMAKSPADIQKELQGQAPGTAKTQPEQTNSTTLKLDPKSRDLRTRRLARAPLEDRGPLAEPPAVLIQGATLWTCSSPGRLELADLLIIGSTIKEVGTNLQLSGDLARKAIIIDGRGKHVTPGLIDAHNHSMILGGVNEGTVPSSAMVRISDVVNSETANIYRQLAGGLTVANLLHGSANPIGGQDCVIKLRDGASPEDLKFAAAPPGIKFALGENVKQSNWGGDNATRFPQTRMGVPTFFANRFTAARRYLQQRQSYQSSDPPLRTDLELEAIAEILQGQRWIHCHSYRQDEILMFLRLMEQFGVKVGTLQHVLEGYKVADEIARHGAGASCFSDWWAYKFEVYDAIPYAGSLMEQRGVLVSFNSDSSDLARRLNLEAAKAVKYGGTPEEAALKFVTSNPARQLHIDSRVGSLAPGKDADFVIWSHSPLDTATVCLQTWIDGRKYFDRERDSARSKALQEERLALIEKAKKILQQPDDPSSSDSKSTAAFFRGALEHQFDHVNRHCLDHE